MSPSANAPAATSKVRVGVDAERTAGPLRLSAEVTVGRDESAHVVGALVWADVTVPAMPSLTIETQARTWSNDALKSGSRWTSAALGAAYRLSTRWTVRGLMERAFEDPGDASDTIAFQLYYYGG